MIKLLCALALSAATMPSWASWKMERLADPMTGAVSCDIASPVIYVQTGQRDQLAPVRLVIQVEAGKVLVMVRLDTDRRGILHPDARGSGMKTEPGAFLPTATRASQTSLVLADSAQAAEALVLAKSVRLRLKFWPYESMVDTQPIPTDGLRQAVMAASACGKS